MLQPTLGLKTYFFSTPNFIWGYSHFCPLDKLILNGFNLNNYKYNSVVGVDTNHSVKRGETIILQLNIKLSICHNDTGN